MNTQGKTGNYRKKFIGMLFGVGMMAAVFAGAPAMASEQTDAAAAVTSALTEAPAATVTPEPTTAPTPTVAAKKTVKKGWVTYKSGGKKYFKNGKYLTGRHKIHGKYYYFSPKNGYMKKSYWATIKGKKYYFGWKGVGCTGLTKIKGSWYLFDKYGALKTAQTTIGKITYYMNDSGTVEAYQKGSTYYTPAGKKMDSSSAANFETLQYAKAVVKQITTSGMSQSQKLLTCFNWVIKHYYSTPRVYLRQENWQTLYANDYLKPVNGTYNLNIQRGDCFSDACAFAFLAKALGYQDVKICVDTKEIGKGHCFAQVDGLFYDPLFAEAKSFSGNYAVPLGVYSLYPMYTVTI